MTRATHLRVSYLLTAVRHRLLRGGGGGLSQFVFNTIVFIHWGDGVESPCMIVKNIGFYLACTVREGGEERERGLYREYF